MGTRRSTRVTTFVDSSVLFTAVNSPSGGSAKLFTVKNVQLVTSPTVLAEVERNVRKKLLDVHLRRFFFLVDQLTVLDQRLNDTLIEKTMGVIVEKDAVILAEAKQSRARIIVTLDKKHFFTEKVVKFLSPTRVRTPKMLISHFATPKYSTIVRA